MVNLEIQFRLQGLLRRESRSFLQYINQATPWAAPEDASLVDKLRRLGEEENAALGDLAVWMDEHRVSLPYLGAFPVEFTNFNFVAIRKLLKPLVREQQKELADLERDLHAVADPGAKAAIATLVDINRKHLRDFEQMTQSPSP